MKREKIDQGQTKQKWEKKSKNKKLIWTVRNYRTIAWYLWRGIVMSLVVDNRLNNRFAWFHFVIYDLIELAKNCFTFYVVILSWTSLMRKQFLAPFVRRHTDNNYANGALKKEIERPVLKRKLRKHCRKANYLITNVLISFQRFSFSFVESMTFLRAETIVGKIMTIKICANVKIIPLLTKQRNGNKYFLSEECNLRRSKQSIKRKDEVKTQTKDSIRSISSHR